MVRETLLRLLLVVLFWDVELVGPLLRVGAGDELSLRALLELFSAG
jgi:hypothetical protein